MDNSEMVVMGVASFAFGAVRTTREIAAAVRRREVSATEVVVLRLMRIFEEARPWPRLAPAPQG